MATKDIIDAASEPVFYTRVLFIALKAAQNVANETSNTANHANRLKFAQKIMRGEEKGILLALHIAAVNATIAGTLAASGGAAVPDGDLEFAMGEVWDIRANAFA